MKFQQILKKVCILLSGAVMSASVCLAAIPYDQVLIGGIGPGSAVSYMKSLYGQPDATNFDTPTQATYTYGNSIVITSNPSDVSTIWTVLSSGHNGLNTPAGVGVGMDEAVITEKYGPCERKGEVNGVTYYHYAMEPNPSLPNAFGGYSFGVENGKIISIWAGVVADDNGAAAAAAVAGGTASAADGTAQASQNAASQEAAPVPVVAPVSPADAKTIAEHNAPEQKETAPDTTSRVTTDNGTTVTIEKTE